MPFPTDIAPTATGTLAKTPMPHLLVYLLDHQMDGSLFVVAGDGSEHVVHFTRGCPSKVRSAFECAHLGGVLLELGFLDRASLDASLESLAQQGGLHGQLLITLGKIDKSILFAGLREQLTRRMVLLFERLDDQASYAFYAGVNLLDDWGGPELTPVDALRLLCLGVRARPEHPHVAPMLSRIGSVPLVLHPAADLGRFGFTREELAVIELLRTRPSSLSEVLGSGLMSEHALKVLVYLLLITRNLDLGKREQMPVGAGQPPPAGPVVVHGPDDPPSSRKRAALARVKLKSVQYVEGAVQEVNLPTYDSVPVPPPAEVAAAPAKAAPSPAASAPKAAQPPAAPAARAAPPGPPAPHRQAVPPPPPAAQRPAPSGPQRPAPAAARQPPPSSPGRPAPPAAPAVVSSDPKIQQWRETIKARVQTIEKENLFIVLGVPENATVDALQAAYFGLAKLWHPDRLPAELNDVKELAAKCFARMSEAFQTLSDADRRVNYQKLLKENAVSPEEQAKVQQVIEAAIDFQKAEVFLKKRDLEQAEVFARRAFQNDPDQPEYAALTAWLTVLTREKAGQNDFVEPLRMLTAAIDREPRCERAYYYRAMVLQRQNRAEQAIRDFRKCVELNARNIDAAREVRLWDMRGGSRGAAESEPKSKTKDTKGSSGLLGKLFKR